jgi:hypothetical protein
MAYLGNSPSNQSFTPAIDYFNGNGVTVTFTLSRPVASVAQVICAIDNVVQNSTSAYTVAGNAITFTSAPLSGTNNIWVQYTSLITTYAGISQDPSVVGDITATGGFLATGDFGNTFTDGTIVDYVTGNARITTGPADGLTIYNGGPTARTALAAWNSSGTLTNTGGAVIQGLTVGKGGGAVVGNVALGSGALATNSVGTNNTALGFQTLNVNTGSFNTATGFYSSLSNTTGTNNTSFGYASLLLNTTGAYNTALGTSALYNNTTASNNTAVGYQAGYSNTTGARNTFVGFAAGYSSAVSNANALNVAVGGYALYSATTAVNNTAIGDYALQSTTGGYNTAIGNGAGYLITSGTKNSILGTYNGNQGGLDIRTASNHIVLSDGDGIPRLWINSTSLYIINGLNSGAGTYPLKYNTSTGQVTFDNSSRLSKENIIDSPYGLAEILALKPRKYYRIDDNKNEIGFVADEVIDILPEFVPLVKKSVFTKNEEDTEIIAGGVNYDKLTAVLVKAIQELNAKLEAQAVEIAALKGAK